MMKLLGLTILFLLSAIQSWANSREAFITENQGRLELFDSEGNSKSLSEKIQYSFVKPTLFSYPSAWYNREQLLAIEFEGGKILFRIPPRPGSRSRHPTAVTPMRGLFVDQAATGQNANLSLESFETDFQTETLNSFVPCRYHRLTTALSTSIISGRPSIISTLKNKAYNGRQYARVRNKTWQEYSVLRIFNDEGSVEFKTQTEERHLQVIDEKLTECR